MPLHSARPKHTQLRRAVVVAALASTGALTMAPVATAHPAVTPAPVQAPAASPAVDAMNVALAQLGDPYVWGAEGPNAFDCSGLVQFSYAQIGIDTPRTTGTLVDFGTPISADQLVPGDFVFAYGGGHMGIYIGDGKYVYAPTTGDVVKIGAVPYASVTDLVRPAV